MGIGRHGAGMDTVEAGTWIVDYTSGVAEYALWVEECPRCGKLGKPVEATRSRSVTWVHRAQANHWGEIPLDDCGVNVEAGWWWHVNGKLKYEGTS